MRFNYAAEISHTLKLRNRLSSKKANFFYTENEKNSLLKPLCGLGATYAVHLMLIGKLVVDFLLVIIKLFFARSRLGLGSQRLFYVPDTNTELYNKLALGSAALTIPHVRGNLLITSATTAHGLCTYN